jgi:hypothetical protein
MNEEQDDFKVIGMAEQIAGKWIVTMEQHYKARPTDLTTENYVAVWRGEFTPAVGARHATLSGSWTGDRMANGTFTAELIGPYPINLTGLWRHTDRNSGHAEYWALYQQEKFLSGFACDQSGRPIEVHQKKKAQAMGVPDCVSYVTCNLLCCLHVYCCCMPPRGRGWNVWLLKYTLAQASNCSNCSICGAGVEADKLYFFEDLSQHGCDFQLTVHQKCLGLRQGIYEEVSDIKFAIDVRLDGKALVNGRFLADHTGAPISANDPRQQGMQFDKMMAETALTFSEMLASYKLIYKPSNFMGGRTLVPEAAGGSDADCGWGCLKPGG